MRPGADYQVSSAHPKQLLQAALWSCREGLPGAVLHGLTPVLRCCAIWRSQLSRGNLPYWTLLHDIPEIEVLSGMQNSLLHGKCIQRVRFLHAGYTEVLRLGTACSLLQRAAQLRQLTSMHTP